jgi:hypothetical protein
MASSTDGTSPPISPQTSPPSSLADTENFPKTEGDDVVGDAITENPFDSESSRILFDAVDQLQHCGASRHVDIPQVRCVNFHPVDIAGLISEYLARHCRRSIYGKVVFAPELD